MTQLVVPLLQKVACWTKVECWKKYPQKPSNCNAQHSPIYCLSQYLIINKTHSIVPLVTSFSTNFRSQDIHFSVSHRYKVRKVVFPKIGLFFLPQYTPYRATVDTDDKPASVDRMYNDEPGISKLKAPL